MHSEKLRAYVVVAATRCASDDPAGLWGTYECTQLKAWGYCEMQGDPTADEVRMVCPATCAGCDVSCDPMEMEAPADGATNFFTADCSTATDNGDVCTLTLQDGYGCGNAACQIGFGAAPAYVVTPAAPLSCEGLESPSAAFPFTDIQCSGASCLGQTCTSTSAVGFDNAGTVTCEADSSFSQVAPAGSCKGSYCPLR